MITNIILGLALILVCAFFFIFYKKANKIINEFKKPIRHGYFEKSLQNMTETINFVSTVFVDELDRYTNGFSKVKIAKIEYGIENDKISHKSVENIVYGEFKSLMKTTDINWLESEESIKEMRRNKLERLKKIIKK